MLWFIAAVALLIAGYFIYGSIVEKVFKINPKRETPAHLMNDGVDYVPMTKKKIWLIQLLNIAGTGPIFGPILGALYGPVAMLWIVFGCIFAGAVHDYFSGMLSVRNGGASVPNLAGKYIGAPVKHFMNALALVLLVLVGVVFVISPAGLLTNITMDNFGESLSLDRADTLVTWTTIIFVYYIIATLVPIDKIIGRIYPLFGALLLFMSFGMFFALLFEDKALFHSIGDMSFSKFFENAHPNNLPIWPLIFVTIACGAVSGFHATQSPLMARCMENEKEGRFVFYGAMIGEGIIALIWCMVGLTFYDSPALMNDAINAGTPSKVVYDSATHMLGYFGGILAVLGVVVLPITSGDTSFRAARLIVAEFFKIDQRNLVKRLMIAIPLFILGFIISKLDFQVIWRYFGWANQTTAMVMLWTAAAYLYRYHKFHWICTIPAIFMTMVSATFLAYAKIGFGLSYETSVWVGIALTVVAIVCFFTMLKPIANGDPDSEVTTA
ncbi:carbon starvation protein A [Gallibacterium anatis]|uniref:Carbon starvation protein CstA n=1 Tax=Gallibacterium anatis TaxID=750 RepID=A0A1A7P652_9PAST|nr:carbon starvation protein A [Gallibacterium anatis]KGQ57292.1 carbon starvation protein CstA [Gallibacterium anatis DSM 16844 = F 149]OBW96052.1 carbon starvation protein CstA [Gallibacterium anatis]OBW97937.1 carbon starvation protein CstA [Gallibacterium anatis]STO38314.1 Inner membrane protein YjiY [Gallibacterium anatis]